MSSARQSNAPGSEHITVVGEARVEVAPEVVDVHLAVQHTADTPQAAKVEVDARCTRVIEIARTLDVDPHDIRAAELALTPQGEGGATGGYAASRQVQIRVRRLGHIQTLLDQLIEVPVNRIERITSGLTDPFPAEQACLTRAIDDAKQKAASIARQFNVRLGRIFSVAALPRNETPWIHASAAPGTAGDVSFQPGWIAMQARIEATFHLERTSHF